MGMREVAKLAGVSLSTVSLHISGSGKYISPEIRKKVEQALSETGYKAPAQKDKDKRPVAVMLPYIASTFSSNVLYGIESTLSEKGHTLIFGNSGYDFEKEKRFLETVRKQNPCGVIIDSVCPIDEEKQYLDMLSECFVARKIPVVLLEQQIEDPAFCYVSTDHYENAYSATKHLIQMGHSKIAHISGFPCLEITLQRLNGYRVALADHGIPFDEGLVSNGDFSPNSGYLAMKNLFSHRMDFTGLFCANDQMAIGAIRAINSIGKNVPDDIAVVGIDNLSISTMVSPSLTTINVPTYQMGYRAADMILKLHSSKACERKVRLDSNLIVRRSTNAYALIEWEFFGW
ncbi:MAG: LacI family transcriptional regulator [Clostridiales bacterium]|jgi:LacI family transcriptional regulator/LacI family repressor for deo operon, udp, cdd, tsx, nupC, and nupG|nr:LacI family transcriptional regulator [Clostridiales bacterium]